MLFIEELQRECKHSKKIKFISNIKTLNLNGDSLGVYMEWSLFGNLLGGFCWWNFEMLTTILEIHFKLQFGKPKGICHLSVTLRQFYYSLFYIDFALSRTNSIPILHFTTHVYIYIHWLINGFRASKLSTFWTQMV